MLRNLQFFLVALLAVVLYFHWSAGLDKVKQEGKDISFWKYAKEDSLTRFDETKKLIKDLPSIINDAIQSDDKVKRGSINKLADGLEIYKAENERYPEVAQKLLGAYINSQTKILEEKGFSYTVTEDGQHFKLSIPLSSGEIYTIQR